MATSLSTPKLSTTLSSPTLHTLYKSKFSLLSLSSNPIIKPFHFTHRTPSSLSYTRRRFTTPRAESTNGAEPSKHYDFDLFTIGAGSGGVRASRFASNFGASVAVCELPFSTISSDTTGGVGGTLIDGYIIISDIWIIPFRLGYRKYTGTSMFHLGFSVDSNCGLVPKGHVRNKAIEEEALTDLSLKILC